MTLECINPEDLPRPQTYTQVVVAKGTRLVFVSGQEPEDVHGRLVGRGDLSVQARQVFANLGRALAAASARPEQVAKITIYVVNYRRDEHLPIIERARVGLFGDPAADPLQRVDISAEVSFGVGSKSAPIGPPPPCRLLQLFQGVGPVSAGGPAPVPNHKLTDRRR